MRDALITGGAGFLGSHLRDELEDSTDVYTPGSGVYDLRERPQIERMLEAYRPDVVFHLAAVVGGIGANRVAPGKFFYENAIMGIELIEACRKAEIPKVVIAGTVCAYPKYTPVPFMEENLWMGYPEETNAPYGLAKRMLLVQGQAYREQYGMNIIYLLPVNLYGPRDNFDLETGHVIPSMIRKFIEARDSDAEAVYLWGDGSASREFLHVRDAARAFHLAALNYNKADPVNLGSGQEIRISILADLIQGMTRYKGKVVWEIDKPNGQPRRSLNVKRAANEFGFEAAIPFVDGLRETIDWFEATYASGGHIESKVPTKEVSA